MHVRLALTLALLAAPSLAAARPIPLPGQAPDPRREAIRVLRDRGALPVPPAPDPANAFTYEAMDLDVTLDPHTGTVDATAVLRFRGESPTSPGFYLLIDQGLAFDSATAEGYTVDLQAEAYPPWTYAAVSLSPAVPAGEPVELVLRCATRVSVAYPGVAERFAPQSPGEVDAVRRRLGLPDRYLLFVGTIQPRKNIRRLLQAHGQVDGAPPLLIAGGAGWLSEPLLRQARAAPDRVRLLGYVADDDLPALMSGASGFVLPSLFEGFGLPVLEAMACGTPVLVSRSSSLPEIVGDCGIIVDPYSVESIAEGIRALCHETERTQDLALRARERARGFTWERCAATVLAALERAHANS